MKWEYKSVHSNNLDNVQLNKLGYEGWEPVIYNTHRYDFIFKRPLPQSGDEVTKDQSLSDNK